MPKTTLLQKPNLSELATGWPPFIARGEIEKFTGGLISSKYLANLDSKGKGPKNRVKVGRKIGYETRALISWIESRAEVVDDHEPAA